MGMYTELVIGVEIEPNKDVIQKLEYMLDIEKTKPDIDISHPFFTETKRWKYMLTCDSYYFSGQTDSKLYKDEVLDEKYYLNVRCNLMNYDNEIELFLDWLCPYICTYGFLGYTRYEEDDDPILIYKEEKGIVYKCVNVNKLKE